MGEYLSIVKDISYKKGRGLIVFEDAVRGNYEEKSGLGKADVQILT